MAEARALAKAEPVVRRVIASRVPVGDVEDLVQATLTRLLASFQRGLPEDPEAYAAVAARNAAASHHRSVARREQVVDSLDLTAPDEADTHLVHDEEAVQLRQVLEGFATGERRLIEAHHIDGEDIATLARRSGRSEMAVRLSLARARAKLRVDYVLAFNKVDLPSTRCRAVLLSLSSGDRRSQHRLEADEHLDRCPTCAALLQSATGQHRPAVGLLALLAWRWKNLSVGRRSLTIGAAASAAVAVVAIATAQRTSPSPQAAPTVTTTVAPTAARPSGRVRTADRPLGSTYAALETAIGEAVDGTAVPVLAVPGDEGFWIAADDGGRLWLQITGMSGESPIAVTPHATVTFHGRVVAHDERFAGAAGLGPGADTDSLTSVGHHLEVAYADLKID
ncbi:hypothetical protein BH10ACT1_BH10ACT1_11900 [soil metagenome]